MNKKKIMSLAMLSLFCLGKASGVLPTKEQEWKEHGQGRVYRLNGKTDSLALINGFTATDTSVEFDLLPQNSAAQAGVLLRYTGKDNWIYVGCEKATDHLGFAHWYVTTPDRKFVLAQDISKWYAHHKRRIKVNCIGQTVTVYVDGEQIAHKHFPGLPASSGQIGFRAHDKGNVHFSNIRFRPLTPTTPRPGKSKDFYTLSSPKMEVKLNKNFPSVHSYLWKKDGSRLDGQPFDIKAVCINGDTYSPKVSGKAKDGKVVYQLDIKEIGIRFDVHCELKENVLSLSIHDIEEKGTCKVRTIAFPQHHLVTVANNAPEARLSIANGVKSDTFLPLKDKEADATHQCGTIVLLNDDKLAATLESNSIYSTRQFLYQTIQTPRQPSTSIWGNEWIYRGHDGNVVNEPYIKVILSDDANGDGKTDWQDGAIALQKEYPQPQGIDLLHQSYATITMNFASFAQYPFLRQLDNIKRFYLATDGFGQMVELKGYQSEGHDSAHPDYAGHYNERAGGKKELAYLAEKARQYNAHIGVHINHSESYPEAKAFNDRIVTDMPAWSWLDQSYFINKEADMLAGSFKERLEQLKKDIPHLAFVYLDTYREYRWLAHQTARLFNQNELAVWTEDPDVFDKEAIWIHYNPESKSLIHRFVHHQFRDGYASHPALLGGYDRGASIGFMGWQKGRDFNGVIRNFFTKQLPYRYLMHHPLLTLDSLKATLTDGVTAYGDGKNGTVIQKGERTLMSGDCVFIPWNPVTEDKIYHYNVKGGRTTWKLPASWKGQNRVYLYELSDLGRTLKETIPVENGEININAQADKGYVVYKEEMPLMPAMAWSEGSPVKDCGFDSQSFTYWKAEGNADSLSFGKTTYGQNYLKIKGNASVCQNISGLVADETYTASVWVNINGKKKAALTLKDGNECIGQASVSESKVKNYTDNTDRYNTTWQRLKVSFRMPKEARSITLSLQGEEAGNDTSAVCFDDVRLVKNPCTLKDGYEYFEDFENVDEGWGPFIPCQPSAFTTHLSQKHGVYTDNTLNGEWSLATWRENNGEVYRTSPTLVRFEPGQTYEVSFDYHPDKSGVYKVAGKSLSAGETTFVYDLNRPGRCQVRFTTPSCDDFYIVIMKQGNGRLVLDDFGIKKIR